MDCPKCKKRTELCVCDQITPVSTRIEVLILQHPQEPDKDLGTALLTHLSLPNSTLKTGLSWPNLKAALGKEANPAQWGVLYLGSGIKSTKPQGAITLVNKAGEASDPLLAQKSFMELKGIVLLDGTWTQAKALWWRNAWLLKLRRLILQPQHESLYGVLRREPRKDCLSTLESTALSLTALGESKEVSASLTSTFEKLLVKYRASAPSRPKIDRRKKSRFRHR